MQNQQDIRIAAYTSVSERPAANAELESIFYGASATQTFASGEARAKFRYRWLTQYLLHNPDDAFLALSDQGRIAGYLVGSRLDPALDPAQADLGYFAELAPHTRLFPAHLHINLATEYRSHGIGSRLVNAFCTHAAAHGAPGVHVVTGQGMRNVGFYTRNGFLPVADIVWNGRPLVMLGRRLP